MSSELRFNTNASQITLQLYCKGYLSAKAVRSRLNVDKILNRGVDYDKVYGQFDYSNDDQIILQMSDMQIVTKEEVAKYFKIASSEKGGAYKSPKAKK